MRVTLDGAVRGHCLEEKLLAESSDVRRLSWAKGWEPGRRNQNVQSRCTDPGIRMNLAYCRVCRKASVEAVRWWWGCSSLGGWYKRRTGGYLKRNMDL